MSMFDLYVLFVLLPAINGLTELFVVIGIFVGLGALASYLVGVMEDSEEAKSIGIYVSKIILVPCLIIGTVCSVFPNEKQVAILIGGYTVTNIEGVEKLPESMVKAVDSYLQQFNTDAKE